MINRALGDSYETPKARFSWVAPYSVFLLNRDPKGLELVDKVIFDESMIPSPLAVVWPEPEPEPETEPEPESEPEPEPISKRATSVSSKAPTKAPAKASTKRKAPSTQPKGIEKEPRKKVVESSEKKARQSPIKSQPQLEQKAQPRFGGIKFSDNLNKSKEPATKGAPKTGTVEKRPQERAKPKGINISKVVRPARPEPALTSAVSPEEALMRFMVSRRKAEYSEMKASASMFGFTTKADFDKSLRELTKSGRLFKRDNNYFL